MVTNIDPPARRRQRQSLPAAGAMRTPIPRPLRGLRWCPPPYTMVVTLLFAWLACSAGEPLSAAMQRRSSRPGVYAATFAGGYRPFAFVAVPLHAPVPVLHVLYPAAAPPAPPRPPARRRAPAAAQPSQMAPVYAAAMPHGWFAAAPAVPAPPPQETALEVVYARPTAQGGYTYSRRRTRPQPPPPPARRPARPQPVVLRVHKYRVVRDR